MLAAGQVWAGESKAVLNVQKGMAAGQPIAVHFELAGHVFPVGSYPSVNIRVLEGPQGERPFVRGSFPDSELTFHAPGTYVVRFVLSQVSKPSCGGVDAFVLLEETRTMIISAP